MNVHLNWHKPLPLPKLIDESIRDFIQQLDADPGIYCFLRAWGGSFEPLYGGRAKNICSRVKQQYNNTRLMAHVSDAKLGKRMLHIGYLQTSGRQDLANALEVAERSLIRRFVSEGTIYITPEARR